MLPWAPTLFLGECFFSLWIRSNPSGLENFNTDNVAIKVAPKAASNVIFGPVHRPLTTYRLQGERQLVGPPDAEVAQSVEHMTENHGVGSSILPLGTTSFFS